MEYEVKEITVINRAGEEKMARIVQGRGVAILFVPTRTSYWEVLPFRQKGDKIFWGYEEGLHFARWEDVEEAMQRGTLHEYMKWGVTPEMRSQSL